MSFRTFCASLSTSRPATRTDPEVFRSIVVSILIVVLFPAPLGPKNPKNSPSLTAKDIPLTAFVPSPYVFTRFSTCTEDVPLKAYRVGYIVSDIVEYKEFRMHLLANRYHSRMVSMPASRKKADSR